MLLEMQNVVKRFGGLTAVSNMSFQVEKGEIFGVIGPNGAGKTTIFNLITGVYPVSEGNILFDGQSISGKKPYQIINGGIARTFQNIRLFTGMTVLENILVGQHDHLKAGFIASILHTGAQKKEEKEARKEAMELLRFVGLEQDADRPATELPYGKQRKLEIARALAAHPKLILLDEPAAGMNPQETKELTEFISQIRQEYNIPILMIEHHMDLVMAIAERIYVLDFGRLIASGTAAEVQDNPDVINAYLGVDEDE